MMDETMKIFWRLAFEMHSNDYLLRQYNPIREFEGDLVDGAIVDIGCGQSPFLLPFSGSDRELIAIDNEQMQLDFLKKRLMQLNPEKSINWNFLNSNFPEDGLPDKRYALMIISDLLHFYSLDDNMKIGKLLAKKSNTGTMIFVRVHSDKYYANDPGSPDNHDYFKHYFSVPDLQKIFPEREFETIYLSQVTKKYPKEETDVVSAWAERALPLQGVTDIDEIEFHKEAYLEQLNTSDLVAIFKKR